MNSASGGFQIRKPWEQATRWKMESITIVKIRTQKSRTFVQTLPQALNMDHYRGINHVWWIRLYEYCREKRVQRCCIDKSVSSSKRPHTPICRKGLAAREAGQSTGTPEGNEVGDPDGGAVAHLAWSESRAIPKFRWSDWWKFKQWSVTPGWTQLENVSASLNRHLKKAFRLFFEDELFHVWESTLHELRPDILQLTTASTLKQISFLAEEQPAFESSVRYNYFFLFHAITHDNLSGHFYPHVLFILVVSTPIQCFYCAGKREKKKKKQQVD